MKRGEIYVVDLGPGVGYEAAGVLPVVVISNDVANANAIIVSAVPAVLASDRLAPLGVSVPVVDSGYAEDISVLARQPRSLDASRFPAQASGVIPDNVLTKIGGVLVVELDL